MLPTTFHDYTDIGFSFPSKSPVSILICYVMCHQLPSFCSIRVDSIMCCLISSAFRVYKNQPIPKSAETTMPNWQVTKPVTAKRLLSLGITSTTTPSVNPTRDTNEPIANVGIELNSGIPMNNISEVIRNDTPRFSAIIPIFLAFSIRSLFMKPSCNLYNEYRGEMSEYNKDSSWSRVLSAESINMNKQREYFYR